MPCSFEGCGRPANDRWVNEILTLYQDCGARGAMPEAGGVMDQSADIMRWFRILDERIAKHKKEKSEKERAQMELGARHG